MSNRNDQMAYVGRNGQVHLMDGFGGPSRQLTYTLNMDSGQSASNCMWPLFSPNRQWIAYFQLSEAGALLCVAENEGIEVRVVAELGTRIPIYAQWNPDSEHIVVLLQADELEAYVYSIENIGDGRCVAKGSPLFMNWTPVGDGLIIHSVHRKQGVAKLNFIPLKTYNDTISISSRPGSFCTPVFVKSGVLFVEGSNNGSFVYMSKSNGDDKRLLTQMSGMVSAMPSLDGKKVAIASAPKGDGAPYRGVSLLDLESGVQTAITDIECQSFWWLGDDLVLTQADRINNCMRWLYWCSKSDTVHQSELFWPTREQIFQIHFFEQFGQSHGMVCAEQRHIVYSGYTSPKMRMELPEPKVFAFDIRNEVAKPELLCAGNFAVMPMKTCRLVPPSSEHPVTDVETRSSH